MDDKNSDPLTDEVDSIPDPNDFDSKTTDDDRLELRAAFAKTLAKNGFSDVMVLSRERAIEVLTKRRREILDYLKDNNPQSVSELARELQYDKGTISRDLNRLAEIGVVGCTTEGQEKSPQLKHRHIVIEPIV